jgi:hypothetical protein
MSRRPTRGQRATLRTFATQADWSPFRAAVSLHAHTAHSREVMADLPRYIARIPLVAARFEQELRARALRDGRAVDFAKGWWHPPVTPRDVFVSEEAQIEERLALPGIVSVTDHDNIDAGVELQRLFAAHRSPISFEWTVPYAVGFFHLGVHNLPPRHAREWFGRLSAFTAGDRTESLAGLLAELTAVRDLLLVFNHPMWDLADVGHATHHALLRRFLGEHVRRLHAVELNGYRSRKENGAVRAIAVEYGLPLISGGDRHGRAPNAILNVTTADSFGAFAEEVRAGVSHVVIMPEYGHHLVARKLAAASDVLRRYPSYPQGRQRWFDRVSCDVDGSIQPLAFHWPTGGPLWVRSAIAAFQIVTCPAVLPLVRTALETVDAHSPVPMLPLPSIDNVGPGLGAGAR